MKILAPSILAADFSDLSGEVAKIERAGAQLLHFDVMDGHFVPNISFGPAVMRSLSGRTGLPFDVHLMVEGADRYIPEFAVEDTAFISVHCEACPHLHRTLELIRSKGANPGVALNPATPLCAIDEAMGHVGLVLVMSVDPGFGGQAFIPGSLDRIRRLARMRQERGLSFLIEVDGGVTLENAPDIAEAGADIFVAGSSVFKAADPAEWARGFFAAVGQ
ncbi:MAG: ribulose-phosphate 3-epimerase [Clostridiales Family XIII bacterium]|jgi:ribulose-phosphate 3-epimerase|nr:ribulose-phosphate 3-epimerase [Clostridiales Family XIII bacterium]